MNENKTELRTNPLDSVQLSLICLIESEAKELLEQGRNPHARRVADACNKLIRWSESTRRQLSPEQREAIDSLTLDEAVARLTATPFPVPSSDAFDRSLGAVAGETG
jgi:hypothetical protein